MLFNGSPPFIQQVGNHAHKGFGLDLASLLQLIQVQSEFKPLGSTQTTHHSYLTPNHVSSPFTDRTVAALIDATVTVRCKQRDGFKRLHCLDIGGQPSQSDVQPLSHGENLLEICGNHLSLDAKSPIRRYGNTVLPPHGHHGPSVIGHNRLKDGRDERDSVSQSLSMHFI